jgi:hypothetical protein
MTLRSSALSGISSASAALWGAGIAGAVSIMVVLMTQLFHNKEQSRAERERQRNLKLDFRVRQLNELYGPLRFLIEQNRRLALKIREGKGDTLAWRLLDHLPEVLADPRDAAIANQILLIDERIEQLIIEKAGLINGTPPQSFDDYLSHFRLLNLAMKGHPVDQLEREYFPRQINDDVKQEYDALTIEITKLLSGSDPN